ncbi:MAG TPA: serine/threonine-protein kinase [Polyangiaceae bacterium]|jgi:serine/threonine protein kinase
MLDGRYELRRVLGQGAEGTVFEAVHRFTGQRVAVKVAANQLHEGTDWKKVRLLREARALGQMRHPNIVTITDAGVADRFPFVAMELLEGRTIEGLLMTRGRFAVSDAVGAALQVCEALNAAHTVGVLHRDVKPGNVIIVRDHHEGRGVERVKLVDFGTSKPTDPSAEKLTAVGALVGTPSYMAPEQLMAQDVDEGVDIYAVGAMLFECLTGAVPYEGAYPRVLMAACSADPPPSIRLVRPQIEATLEGVIGKALAKKRSDRFATIGELADALRRACPQIDGLTRLLDGAAPVAPRRKFNRAPYRTPISIKSSWGEVTGRSEDISEGGMLVLSDQACQQGEEVSVRFALPIEGRVAVCKARVQWVRARPNHPGMNQAIGLELVGAPSDLRASLARYVALMTGELKEPVEPMPAPKRMASGSKLVAVKETVPGTPASLRQMNGHR